MVLCMSIRDRFLRALLAFLAWALIWGLLGGIMAVGLSGERSSSDAIQTISYGGASGIVLGLLAFFGWWSALPLWLRGALYGVLAALTVLVGAVVLFQFRDVWKFEAATILSGLFGYLFREVFSD